MINQLILWYWRWQWSRGKIGFTAHNYLSNRGGR